MGIRARPREQKKSEGTPSAPHRRSNRHRFEMGTPKRSPPSQSLQNGEKEGVGSAGEAAVARSAALSASADGCSQS
eukprot:5880416-Prymnesium_polylepis.1